jgi:hypothetical protein
MFLPLSKKGCPPSGVGGSEKGRLPVRADKSIGTIPLSAAEAEGSIRHVKERDFIRHSTVITGGIRFNSISSRFLGLQERNYQKKEINVE